MRLLEFFSTVNEQFTTDQSSLKNYLSDPSEMNLDPYMHWDDMIVWLDEYHPEISAKINREDPSSYHEFPDAVRQELESDIGSDLQYQEMQHNPAELDTKAHVDFRRMVKTPEWYVHFSDDANNIASKGFTIGVDDMTKLGLTTHFKNDSFNKKYGGYNFAFMADSGDAISVSRTSMYGDNFVMFNMRGAVEVYHYGDQETQYIVYGKELDPRNLILVEKDDEGEYAVAVHPSKWSNAGADYVTNPMSYEAVIQWVAQNYDQYRKLMTGW